jgi:hypothetical protein
MNVIPLPRRRVFCLSMPRNGTGSVARLLRDVGLATSVPSADAVRGWIDAWHRGDFEAIFASDAFRQADVLVGAPWCLPEFYKVLFQRFPGARFVLLTREPDGWFRSLEAAGDGLATGDNRTHAKAFRRELDFLRQVNAGEIDDRRDDRGRMLSLRGQAAHYCEIYRLHNSEVMGFFGRHAPAALHWGELEDPRKWQRLAAFLGVPLPAGYQCHLNAGSAARALAG